MIPVDRPVIRVLIFTIILFGFTHFSADAVTPAFVQGEPGLSYRYVETFGETGVPFLVDTGHIYYPGGVGVDASGNLWVAETNGSRALKYSRDGEFLQSIGTAGSFWIVDETHFGEPSDAVVDSDGNVWVVDLLFGRAVKYDSEGAYLKQVGIDDQGGTDNERLDRPAGIALDSAGRIYVSDSNNQRIQIFDPSGVYSATIGVTGEPGPQEDRFQNPQRITIDVDDNLYVADSGNQRIQIFDTNGVYSATIGVTGVSGSENIQLNNPMGVTVDADRIYVADTYNNRVQIFDRTTLGYLATLGTGWGSGDYEFKNPNDVAVDADGNLYVADADNHRVQKFNDSLQYVRTFGTTDIPYLTDGYHYFLPDDVAVDRYGNIGILEDWHGERFIKLDAKGSEQFTIGEAGIAGDDLDHLSSPAGIDFDTLGNIYIADCSNHRVQIFNSDGDFQETLGSGPGSGQYQFDCPSGVTIDGTGNIIVADRGNRRVQIYDKSHVYKATVGVTGESGVDNQHFESPIQVAADASGNIFVADVWNFRVQKCSWSNTGYSCSTFAGETGVYESDFSHLVPMDVDLDSSGRVFVTDQWNHRIQVFDASGAYLTTIGGEWGTETGRMSLPTGVAVDQQGNVYVADWVNHRIQKFAPGVPGWRQANINGFGELQNSAIFSLTSYKGELYAGTANESGNGAQLWSSGDGKNWTSIMEDGFGNAYNRGIDHLLEFNGYLYAGTWADEVNGGEIWRSQNGRDWSPVVSGGFGNAINSEIHHFVTFKDQLYATTWSSSDLHGTELWRSSTGNPGSWSKVVFNGFNNDVNNAVALSLHVFDGYLYAGTLNTTTGGEVWRSSSGTTWTQVNVDGFGIAENRGVSALRDFNGYLYAATRGTPTVSGDQVWRCQICDGSDWKKVVNNGFGNDETSDSAALVVLKSSLYLVAGNASTGAEVWRTSEGTNWEQVDSAGFGDSNNRQPYWGNSIGVFQDRLFVGVSNGANGGEIWTYTGFPVYLPFMLQNFK